MNVRVQKKMLVFDIVGMKSLRGDLETQYIL